MKVGSRKLLWSTITRLFSVAPQGQKYEVSLHVKGTMVEALQGLSYGY